MTGPRSWPPHQLLGAVLAGGESKRYGRAKALALVGGRPMAVWSLDALRPHFPMIGMVGNEPVVAQVFGVQSRRDVLPGLGPLGGLITALEWAKDMRLRGAFILGCDMPLITAALIGRVLDFRGPRTNALVPASTGPLGMEPLCAAYSVDCLGPARELTRSGPRSMKALLDGFDFDLIPLHELGDPRETKHAFTNVNTIEAGYTVEAVLESRKETSASGPDQPAGVR